MEEEDTGKERRSKKEWKQPKQTPRGKDIGLMIYTLKSTGCPKETLTQEKLIKGIKEDKYKMTYRNELMEGE